MKASRAIAIICIIVGMCFAFDKITARIIENMQEKNSVVITNEYNERDNTNYIEEDKENIEENITENNEESDIEKDEEESSRVFKMK